VTSSTRSLCTFPVSSLIIRRTSLGDRDCCARGSYLPRLCCWSSCASCLAWKDLSSLQ
jgi:hypothetical protein